MKHALMSLFVCILFIGSIFMPQTHAEHVSIAEEKDVVLNIGVVRNHTIWITVDNEGNTSVHYSLNIFYAARINSKHPLQKNITDDGVVSSKDYINKYYPIPIRFGITIIELGTDTKNIMCIGIVMFRYVIILDSST